MQEKEITWGDGQQGYEIDFDDSFYLNGLSGHLPYSSFEEDLEILKKQICRIYLSQKMIIATSPKKSC